MTKVHFIGAAGAGVSALAQFHAMAGMPATGSDRSFDQGLAGGLRARLEAAGVRIFPQDGGALDGSHDHAVASAAVEGSNADLARARALGLRVLHRADCLAGHVASMRAIAVAGTSGKSTVAAMIFETLEASGRSPSVITGGPLVALERRGLAGNAFRGSSDLLVVEADESDGTLVKYRPWLGLMLNLARDHKEVSELAPMFEAFKANSASFAVHAGGEGTAGFERGGLTFGIGAGDVAASGLELGPEAGEFDVGGVRFRLPCPGRHNVENAVAAIAACLHAGVSLAECAAALARFQGVARRLQLVGLAGGVAVLDDYAHNPSKVAAALTAARLRGARLHAVFQLHGYGPARFMKDGFIEAFAASLTPEDTLWMPEIFYAGGTASRTISARDIASAVEARGRRALFFERREDILPALADEARPGDVVLVMGARDPSLPDFARGVLAALAAR